MPDPVARASPLSNGCRTRQASSNADLCDSLFGALVECALLQQLTVTLAFPLYPRRASVCCNVVSFTQSRPCDRHGPFVRPAKSRPRIREACAEHLPRSTLVIPTTARPHLHPHSLFLYVHTQWRQHRRHGCSRGTRASRTSSKPSWTTTRWELR